MKNLILILALVGLPIHAHAGEVSASVGVGKMLNNSNPVHPGLIAAAQVQVGWLRTSISKTSSSELSLHGSATYAEIGAVADYRRWSAVVGAMSYMNYDPRVDWLGKLYPNDGQHFTKTCHWCGYTTEIDYQMSRHLQLQMEYVQVTHMSPTYQGPIIRVMYTIGAGK